MARVPRTLEELDAAVAANETAIAQLQTFRTNANNRFQIIESWDAAARLTALEAFRAVMETFRGNTNDRFRLVEDALERVRDVLRGLRQGRLVDVDGSQATFEVQERFTAEEMRDIRWLIAERRKARTRR